MFNDKWSVGGAVYTFINQPIKQSTIPEHLICPLNIEIIMRCLNLISSSSFVLYRGTDSIKDSNCFIVISNSKV